MGQDNQSKTNNGQTDIFVTYGGIMHNAKVPQTGSMPFRKKKRKQERKKDRNAAVKLTVSTGLL